MDWNGVAAHIAHTTGTPFVPEDREAVGGGCINSAVVLRGGGRSFFVKTNDRARLPMFEAESEGLRELARAKSVRVPQPICCGEHDDHAYLVLEHVPLAHTSGTSDEQLGAQLARMHRVTQARYGWQRNNTIGSTPQINTATDDWVGFWREYRLNFQYRLAEQQGHGIRLARRIERLSENLPVFFDGYRPQASLLHGDLWAGNYGATTTGEPVIFDPAVYFGDRECDIAMTELFGGFSARFYRAYNATWPLHPGYAIRKTLYNLYHILNHLNLFGGTYLGRAQQMVDTLLNEVR